MIRPLTEEDVPALVRFAQQAHREGTSFDHYTPDWRYVGEYLLGMFDAGMIFGFIEEGVGCVFAGMYRNWFSPDVCAAELLTYVEPERRGTRLAYDLYAALVEESEALGCTELVAGSTLDINRPAVARLLTRLGFEEGPPGFTITF